MERIPAAVSISRAMKFLPSQLSYLLSEREMRRNIAALLKFIAVLTATFATGQIIGPTFAGTVHDLTGGFAAALLVTAVILAATAMALVIGLPRKGVPLARDC